MSRDRICIYIYADNEMNQTYIQFKRVHLPKYSQRKTWVELENDFA
jgi:hypothetical protein